MTPEQQAAYQAQQQQAYAQQMAAYQAQQQAYAQQMAAYQAQQQKAPKGRKAAAPGSAPTGGAPEGKNSKAKFIVAAVVAVALVAVAAVVGVSMLGSDDEPALGLDHGANDSVVYTGDAHLLDEDELISRAGELVEQFRAEQIDHEAATAGLDAIANPEFVLLTGVIAEARTAINELQASRDAFAAAEELYAGGDYLAAAAQFARVIEDDPNYATAQTRITDATNAFRTAVLAEADDLVAADNHAGAMAALASGLVSLPDDQQLTVRMSALEAGFIEASISAANELAGDGYHDDAIVLLTQALTTLPDNEALVARRTEISDMRPTDIRSMTSINDTFVVSTVTRDNYQNEYVNVAFMDVPPWGGSRAFHALLDYQFTALRGTAFIAYGTTYTGISTVRIEADGSTVALFDLDRTTRPIEIDIDLSAVNDLRIVVSNPHRGPNSPRVFFSNLRFYPLS
jgi:tetratricopeptide (TPR) repeat protein